MGISLKVLLSLIENLPVFWVLSFQTRDDSRKLSSRNQSQFW